jgi:3-dehydroquinate dehydratase-1
LLSCGSQAAFSQIPAWDPGADESSLVSDAIPKKRGPKTDVLEALLKRVDGLEKRLQEEKGPIESSSAAKAREEFTADGPTIRRDATTSHRDSVTSSDAGATDLSEYSSNRRGSTAFPAAYEGVEESSTKFRQQYAQPNASQPVTLPDAVLDAFFARIHGKPFAILDEHATRQKHRLGQLPLALAMAIYALTVRCVGHPLR